MLRRISNFGVLIIVMAIGGLVACEDKKVDCMPLNPGVLAAKAPEKVTEAQCITALRTEGNKAIKELSSAQTDLTNAKKHLEAFHATAEDHHVTFNYDETSGVVTWNSNEVAAAPVDVPAVDPNVAPASAVADPKAKSANN